MTKTRSLCAMGGVALALLAGAGSAQARGDVNWSIGLSSPGVVVGVGNGYPVYTAPRPIYYAPPPPVYYAPPPPVYYAPPRPIYYAPPPPVVYYNYGSGGRHHGHRGRHNHHHGWDR